MQNRKIIQYTNHEEVKILLLAMLRTNVFIAKTHNEGSMIIYGTGPWT